MTIKRMRKKVPKPSTMSRLENARPGRPFAETAATIARMNDAIARCPKSRGSLRAKSGSRTIISVPATVRMVSGRNRWMSAEVGMKLPSMEHASCGGRGRRNSQRRIGTALLQNLRVRLGNNGQKALRVHSHPDHHDHQRDHAGPFARVELRHMVFEVLTGVAEEHTLVKPKHVAGGKEHAERGEDRPGEISLRR